MPEFLTLSNKQFVELVAEEPCKTPPFGCNIPVTPSIAILTEDELCIACLAKLQLDGRLTLRIDCECE